MATSEDLSTYAGRLNTFLREHIFAKSRRTSSTKKKAHSAITWPHSTIAPEALARAGFYYKPSTASSDSVTCFLCDKALDGWEAGDNPATEHLNHVPDCGWAINVCIEQRSQDMDRAEEDPYSEKMMKARRDTFRDVWPHEGRKGWKCKVDNMVKAGWCYDPLPEADDCVKCNYCGVSLDGWEPKDDPWVEHQKRAPDCHFFFLIEESKKLKNNVKKGKGRASRGSRASRMSTQSETIMEPSLDSPPMSDDEAAEEGDTMLTTTSTTSRARKGPRKGTKRAAATKKTKATRAHQASVATEIHPTVEDLKMPGVFIDSPVVQEKPAKLPKTRTKRQTSTARTAPEEDESMIKRPTRKASRVKTASRQEVDEDLYQSQQEVYDTYSQASPVIASKPPTTTKATRGTKRTSDGLAKLDSSVVVFEPAVEEQTEEPTPKPSRKGRGPPKDVEHSIVEQVEMPEVESKPKRGRGRPSKIQSTENSVTEFAAPVPEVDPREQPKRKRGRPSKQSLEASKGVAAYIEDNKETIAAPPVPQGKATRNRTASKQQPPVQIDESPPNAPQPSQTTTTQPQPQPIPTPTPSKSLPESPRRPIRSPTGSPQSSDAENQPPSSRPSLASQHQPTPSQTRQLSHKVPLGPSTPRASPTKRNIINSLSSVQPWTAVDLESIFLPSPASREKQLGRNELDLDSVMNRLTSPERNMSVEDWILWNARGAEEQLRGECERLIGSFETEGNRALQCLEGVEVV